MLFISEEYDVGIVSNYIQNEDDFPFDMKGHSTKPFDMKFQTSMFGGCNSWKS